jgi:uncharacterized protein YciI
VYVAVFFRPGPRVAEREQHAAAHEAFVTSLIERNLVLLGGDFVPPVANLDAAYVLHCESIERALEIAAEDPIFSAGVYEPQAARWELIGINLDAIEPSLT